jgi:hypothetical protein
MAVLCLLVLLALVVQSETGFPTAKGVPRKAYELTVLVLAYLTLFLGIGRAILLLIPRRERFGVVLPLATHLLIVVTAIVVPLSIQSFSRSLIAAGYTPLQLTNWAWTIEETFDGGLPYPEVLYLVILLAVIVFFVNLILAAREIETVRLETPTRVQREEEARMAARYAEHG